MHPVPRSQQLGHVIAEPAGGAIQGHVLDRLAVEPGMPSTVRP